MKTNKIPRLQINRAAVMAMADSNRDLLTYESDSRLLSYATDKKEILIVTNRNGYLRIPNEDAKTMLEDLAWIIENNERFGR